MPPEKTRHPSSPYPNLRVATSAAELAAALAKATADSGNRYEIYVVPGVDPTYTTCPSNASLRFVELEDLREADSEVFWHGLRRRREHWHIAGAGSLLAFHVDDSRNEPETYKSYFRGAGWPMGIGVVTSWLGTGGKLTEAQLYGLNQTGAEVVNHTKTHPNGAPPATYESCYDEIIGAKQAIEALTDGSGNASGQIVRLFSKPDWGTGTNGLGTVAGSQGYVGPLVRAAHAASYGGYGTGFRGHPHCGYSGYVDVVSVTADEIAARLDRAAQPGQRTLWVIDVFPTLGAGSVTDFVVEMIKQVSALESEGRIQMVTPSALFLGEPDVNLWGKPDARWEEVLSPDTWPTALKADSSPFAGWCIVTGTCAAALVSNGEGGQAWRVTAAAGNDKAQFGSRLRTVVRGRKGRGRVRIRTLSGTATLRVIVRNWEADAGRNEIVYVRSDTNLTAADYGAWRYVPFAFDVPTWSNFTDLMVYVGYNAGSVADVDLIEVKMV